MLSTSPLPNTRVGPVATEYIADDSDFELCLVNETAPISQLHCCTRESPSPSFIRQTKTSFTLPYDSHTTAAGNRRRRSSDQPRSKKVQKFHDPTIPANADVANCSTCLDGTAAERGREFRRNKAMRAADAPPRPLPAPASKPVNSMANADLTWGKRLKH